MMKSINLFSKIDNYTLSTLCKLSCTLTILYPLIVIDSSNCTNVLPYEVHQIDHNSNHKPETQISTTKADFTYVESSSVPYFIPGERLHVEESRLGLSNHKHHDTFGENIYSSIKSILDQDRQQQTTGSRNRSNKKRTGRNSNVANQSASRRSDRRLSGQYYPQDPQIIQPVSEPIELTDIQYGRMHELMPAVDDQSQNHPNIVISASPKQSHFVPVNGLYPAILDDHHMMRTFNKRTGSHEGNSNHVIIEVTNEPAPGERHVDTQTTESKHSHDPLKHSRSIAFDEDPPASGSVELIKPNHSVRFTSDDAQFRPFKGSFETKKLLARDRTDLDANLEQLNHVHYDPQIDADYQQLDKDLSRPPPDAINSDNFPQAKQHSSKQTTSKNRQNSSTSDPRVSTSIKRQFGSKTTKTTSTKWPPATRKNQRQQRTTQSPMRLVTQMYKQFNDHMSLGSEQDTTDMDQDAEFPSVASVDSESPEPASHQSGTLSSRASNLKNTHRSIVLQQVNPSSESPIYQTIGVSQSGSSSNNQPAYKIPLVQQQVTSQQYQFQPKQPSNVYTLQSGGSGSVKFLTSDEIMSLKPMGSASTTNNNLAAQQTGYAVSASHLYPRDLQNQPQTIQITALPNALAGPNQVVRFNGQVGWPNANNGWFANNFAYNQYDALGRPLLFGAERRQEWPNWFYPMILIMSLPLILGALFVPIFLKTIIVLLQVLQSLGLLLPLTNVMSQHLLQASGLTQSSSATTTGSNNTSNLHYELPKT